RDFHVTGVQTCALPILNPQKPVREDAEPDDYDDGLWATGGKIIIASIGTMLTIAVLTFLPSGEALFAVVISIFYTTMFFGVPFQLGRASCRERVSGLEH